jgi:hypothetical protein
VIERFFSERRERKRKEYISRLTRRVVLIYILFPQGPEIYVDGPCCGEIAKSKIPALSREDNAFLALDGKEKQQLTVQISADGDDTWVGFSVNGRRVRLFQEGETLELHHEKLGVDGWMNQSTQEVRWERMERALDFIQEEFASTG